MSLFVNARAATFVLSVAIIWGYRNTQACLLKNEELDCRNFTYNERLISKINASHYVFERVTFVGSRILIIPQLMFIGFENVKMIEFSTSKIHFIEPGAFDSMTRIEKLRLHANRMTEIEPGTFNLLTTLKSLDLSWNRLNDIKQYYFSNLTNLEVLWLNNNNIKHLESYSLRELFKLRSLFLYDNYLDVVDSDCFMDLTYLNTLYLSGNNLTDFDTDVFDGLTRLTQLYINNNNLSTIRMRWFHSLIALRRLDINNNALEEFNGQDLLSSLPSLSEIRLNDNLWSCSTVGENLRMLSDKKVTIFDNNTENGVFGIACQNQTLVEARGIEEAFSKTFVGLIVIVVLSVLVVVLALLLITVHCKFRRTTFLRYRSTHFDDIDDKIYHYVRPQC